MDSIPKPHRVAREPTLINPAGGNLHTLDRRSSRSARTRDGARNDHLKVADLSVSSRNLLTLASIAVYTLVNMQRGRPQWLLAQSTIRTAIDSPRNVHRVHDGWQATIWFGGLNGLGTNVTHVVFTTREQARRADTAEWSTTSGLLRATVR